MKKLLLLFTLLLTSVGAWADFTQTYNGSTPWMKSGFIAPSAVSTIQNSGWTIGMSETPVTVSGNSVTVVFDWNNVASCGLNTLGVDLVDPATLQVVASSYSKGKDSASPEPSYRLNNLTAGNYILRYFVQEDGNNDALSKTGGTVSVTGATLFANMPLAGRFYRIKGQNANRPYVGYTLSGSSIEVKADAEDAGIYYVVPVENETTKAKLLNFQTGMYFSNGNPVTLSLSDDNITFYNEDTGTPQVGVKYKMQVNNNNYVFNNTTTTDTINGNGTYILHEGRNNAASEKYFYFESVEQLPVTIGASGYATFYSPVAVTLPDGLDAYYVSNTTSASATMTQIASKVVPAETAIILKGEADTQYNLQICGTTTVINNNRLSGTVAPTYIEKDAYVLSKPNEGQLGFYKAQKNQQNNAAWLNNGFKAYLSAENIPSETRYLVFDFGTETGIAEVENSQIEIDNTEVYDLTGRRVKTTQKGIYIVNGKVVMM